MRNSLFLILFLLLVGCSATEQTTKTEIIEVPVVVPGLTDTINLRDTILLKDTLWYGEVKDSLGKVVGDLKFWYERKIAELRLNKRIDTVKVKIVDTLKVKDVRVIETISGMLNWWEEAVLILVAVLLLAWKGKRTFKF